MILLLVLIVPNIVAMEVTVLDAPLAPLVPLSIAMEIADLQEQSVTTNAIMVMSISTALNSLLTWEIAYLALQDNNQIAMEFAFFPFKLTNHDPTEFAIQDSTASNSVMMETIAILAPVDKYLTALDHV